jgi:hypothetical protein
MVHVPVPVHPAPLQPEKMDPVTGVAVKITVVPELKPYEHVEPQLIPAGLLVTIPLPVPDLLTVSMIVCRPKFAVTEVAAVMLTVQVPAPVQPAPLQPVKIDPGAARAVNVTAVLDGKEYEQLEPQLIPTGLLLTVPLPAPVLPTLRVYEVFKLKLAVTVTFVAKFTVQVPVPEQPPPLQPVKVEPAAAVAVNVTTVFAGKEYEQVEPQLIPDGLLVTVPFPLPVLPTPNVGFTVM